MKNGLIISPYFPPVNAADMQRVRMSLPFFNDFGWNFEIVTVADKYSDFTKDPLLVQSLPANVRVHYIKALDKRWTSKFGLGSIALRSLWFYRKKVNQLLKEKKFDLIFFSTAQFPVCILGAYWKKRFGIPYVIDMQDPWYSDYYRNKPRRERPPKYWFSQRLSKYLEPIAMKKVDGLMSVSQPYLQTLSSRYENCQHIPGRVITFGAFEKDLEIANANQQSQPSLLPDNGLIKIVYIGRGGADMKDAVELLFNGFRKCLDESPILFKNFHFYFLGTSYAASGTGERTIKPVAEAMNIGDHVTENPDRIPFYQTLNTLAAAHALFIPGSNDPNYTASKIYPYIMLQKPLLAIFHPASSVVNILGRLKVGTVVRFDEGKEEKLLRIKGFLQRIALKETMNVTADPREFSFYTAKTMTSQQCDLFQEVTG